MTSAVRVTSSGSKPEAKGASYDGGLAEWLNAPVLKTGEGVLAAPSLHPFESDSLRSFLAPNGAKTFSKT